MKKEREMGRRERLGYEGGEKELGSGRSRKEDREGIGERDRLGN